jgi:hypothetical protein
MPVDERQLVQGPTAVAFVPADATMARTSGMAMA